MDDEPIKQKFCQDCGLSLTRLDTWCLSKTCSECGKEVFFVRRTPDGGIRVEKGERFHTPEITLSLDPKSGGQFTRYGMEGFIKQLFQQQPLKSKEDLVGLFKEIEQSLDKELSGLDCISHCNLETEAGVNEALKTLDSHDLNEYLYNLLRSGLLRQCYTATEEDDALTAAYTAHQAQLLKEYSLLEHLHLKEILWLGYTCYINLAKNENTSEQAAMEERLVKAVLPKIQSKETEYLYALANDGSDIAPRLSISGISEHTLLALLNHELIKREKAEESSIKHAEIDVHKSSNKIKLYGFLFTLANGLILALYKDWIG